MSSNSVINLRDAGLFSELAYAPINETDAIAWGKSAGALIKQPKILIFDEATSSSHVVTVEHFCATINQPKGNVAMIFITHALPKNLQVDEIVQIGVSQSSPESALNSLEVVGTSA
jgi:hypothetical protein